METLFYIIPLIGLIALLFATYKNFKINSIHPGNSKMQQISLNISNGAMTFLKCEYKVLFIFILIISVLLIILHLKNPILMLQSISFIIGSICSALSG